MMMMRSKKCGLRLILALILGINSKLLLCGECGNKYEYLSDLAQHVPILNNALKISKLDYFCVNVPAFIGISHKTVKEILQHAGYDLPACWNIFIKKLDPDGKLLKEALGTKILGRRITKALEQFGRELVDEFEKLSQCEYSCDLLGDEFKKFIAHAKHKNWQLMVRSSGHEDSCTFSNAGGNHTEINVCPTWRNILLAMGGVVASYVSAKSLAQRLTAGDTTIFDSPFVPVLIQRMVGEDSERHGLSVGCVLYTQEPLGQTPGVVSVISSLGHNEGVVNNSVSTDKTYIVKRASKFWSYSVVGEKPFRLVPVPTGGLSQKYNDRVQKTAFSLQSPNNVLCKSLYVIAETLQDHYHCPLDIELIVIPECKKIYLVQVRPIVRNDTMRPSYCREIPDYCDWIQGDCIVSADCGVRHIVQQDDIICAKTLAQALSMYQKKSNTDGKCVIVVERDAQAQSHAAIIFQHANIPVLRVKAFENVSTWCKKDPVNLFIDVQRGGIIHGPDCTISSGWYFHPIPLHLSVPVRPDAPFRQAQESPQTGCNFQTRSKEKKHIKIKNFGEYSSLEDRDLFALLKYAPAKQTRKVLSILLYRLNLIKKYFIRTSCDKMKKTFACDALTKIGYLEQEINNVIGHYESVSNLPAYDIQRLLPIKLLEALWFQEPCDSFINNFSVTSVCNTFQEYNIFLEAHKLSKELVGDKELFVLIYKGCRLVMTKALEDRWINWVERLLQTGKRKNLIALMNNIDSLGIFASWLNLSFAASDTRDARKLFKKIQGELNQTQNQFALLRTKRQEITACDASLLALPEYWEKQEKIIKDLMTFFMSENLLCEYLDKNRENICAFYAVISLMEQFITYYDSAIKALAASSQYKNVEQKVDHFITLVNYYHDLWLAWIAHIAPQYLGLPNQKYIEFYVHHMKKFKEQMCKVKRDRDELTQNSAWWFSAERTVITNTSPRYPNVIKANEFFTLIHQNLLVLISAWLHRNTIHKDVLPEFIQKLTVGKIIGLEFGPDKLTLHYNSILNVHSMLAHLTYNKKDSSAELTCRFMGSDCDQRWNIIQRCAVESILDGYDLIDAAIYEYVDIPLGTYFTYRLTPDTNVAYLSDMIDFMKTLTFKQADLVYKYRSLGPDMADHPCYDRLVRFILRHIDTLARKTVFDCVCPLVRDAELAKNYSYAFPVIMQFVQEIVKENSYRTCQKDEYSCRAQEIMKSLKEVDLVVWNVKKRKGAFNE